MTVDVDPFTATFGSQRGQRAEDRLDASAPSRLAREQLQRLLECVRARDFAAAGEALRRAHTPLAPLQAQLLAAVADVLVDAFVADSEHANSMRDILYGVGVYPRLQATHVLIDAGRHANANAGTLHLHGLGAWQWSRPAVAVCGARGSMALAATRGAWQQEPQRRCRECEPASCRFLGLSEESADVDVIQGSVLVQLRAHARRRLALPLLVSANSDFAFDVLLVKSERAFYDALADVCVDALAADGNWAVHHIIREDVDEVCASLQAAFGVEGEPDCSHLLDVDDWTLLVSEFIARYHDHEGRAQAGLVGAYAQSVIAYVLEAARRERDK